MFRHSHYKAFFMTLNSKNFGRFRPNRSDAFVHNLCFGIDFTQTFSEQKELIFKVN
jgi:hypothetical protein